MARTLKDFLEVRKRCQTLAGKLFEDFDRKRRPILLDVCREFYPLGVAGLEKTIENVADECPYDDDHRLLTLAPLMSLRNGACGFKSHLTPNAGGWFRFRPRGGVGATDEQKTMDRLAKAVEGVFARSRAYDALYKCYEHLLVAGFACMLVTKHKTDIARVQTLRLGTYAMDVNDEGDIVRIVRRFSWPAEKILSAFGAQSCPERIRAEASKPTSTARWTIYNIIEPTARGDLKAYDPVAKALGLADEMAYRSIYWLEQSHDDDPDGGILETSGFLTKPIVAPRLDRELGDVYGRGRGIDALCAARGVQSFTFDILSVSGLRGQPPLIVSSEFKDEGFRAGRGGVNYARFGEQSKNLAYPLFAQIPDTVDLRECRRDAQAEINDIFFNSSFATIDALKNNPGVKTATEVDNLVRENMERLGPIVMNLERELLDPLVSAVASYAVDAFAAPLEEADLQTIGAVDVEYVSRLHMAAQARRVSDIDAWIARIGPLAESKPEVFDKVNADKVADEYAEMLGVPAEVRASDNDVAAARARRAEVAQMQAQAARTQQLADIAKMGSVPVDKEHLGGVVKDAMMEDQQ